MELEQVGRSLSEKEIERQEFHALLEKIEDKERLEKVLKSEDWGVWRKVWAQTRDWAQHELNGIDPNDTKKIIRLQIMIDFYDNVLKRSIENYRMLGKEALEIAKERRWLDRLSVLFQKI